MKKNVLHLNTNMKSAAVTIPYRIHQGYIKQGWNSYMLTANTDDSSKYENVIEIPGQRYIINFAARIFRNIWFGKIAGYNKYYYFPNWSFRIASLKKIIKVIGPAPDFIIAHWTNFFFNAKLVYRIVNHFQVPVILYLMDEEPYTGGCHMTYDCDHYKTGCRNCSALRVRFNKGLSYRSALRKKKWFEKLQPIAVAASDFSFNRLSASYIFKNIRKEKILLPFDETIFCPGDRETARQNLGIPVENKYILFGAASICREEKGMIYLIKALNILKQISLDHSNIKILVVGAGDVTDILPFPYINIGFVDSCEKMAEVYRACDVYLSSSIQDAGPAMVNESLMCGRPVVCFNIGVATDLITNEVGYVARFKDSQDLATGLNEVLARNNNDWQETADKCREVALEKFSLLNQLRKIQELVEN